MHLIPVCFDQAWWTEAHPAWAEAIALILIFGLELILAYFTLQEHKEARHERRQAEIARQRGRSHLRGSDVNSSRYARGAALPTFVSRSLQAQWVRL
jgi:hypothetical protein